MKPFIHIGVLCFLMTSGWLWSQSVQIGFVQYESFNPWTFRARLTGSSPQRVLMRGELRDGEGRVVGLFDLGRLLLNPGENTFLSRDVRGRMQGVPDTLMPGNYQYCMTAWLEDVNQETGRGCTNIVLGTKHASRDWQYTPTKSKQTPQSASFSGETRISMQHSAPPNVYQDFPSTFVRWESQAHLEALGLPMRMNSFLSTEHQSGRRGNGRYDVNSINLSVDMEAYWQGIREKLLKKLEREKMALVKGIQSPGGIREKLASLKEETLRKRFPDIMRDGVPESLDSILMHQNKLAERAKQLEQVLENKVFTEAKAQWEHYEEQFNLDSPARSEKVLDSLREHDPAAASVFEQAYNLQQQYALMKERKSKLEAQVSQGQKGNERLAQYAAMRKASPEAMLHDPAMLQKLSNTLPGKKHFLQSIDRFGIGTVFLSHNPLSLDGLALQGIDIASQHGLFYVGNSSGRVQGSTLAFDSAVQIKRSWLLETQLGLGNPQSNHAHVHLQHGWGEDRNVVWGFSGGYKALGEKLHLHAHMRSSHAAVSQGLAYDLHGRLDAGLGNIQLRYQLIEKDYNAFGAPLLIRGRKRIAFSWDGKLFKQLDIGAFYRHDEGQTNPALPGQANPVILVGSRKQAGLRLQYRPQKGPYSMISFAPILSGIHEQSILPYVFSINSSWQYRLGSMHMLSSVSLFHQRLQLPGSLLPDQDVLQLQLNQSMKINRAMQLLITSSYTDAPLDSAVRQRRWMLGPTFSIQSSSWGSLRLGVIGQSENGTLRAGVSGGYQIQLGAFSGLIEYQYQQQTRNAQGLIPDRVLRVSSSYRF